jgi:hypothetical protein
LLLCFSGTIVCKRVNASTLQQNTSEKFQITTYNSENVTLTINGNISAAEISDVWFVNRPDFYNNADFEFTLTGQNNSLGFLNMTIPKARYWSVLSLEYMFRKLMKYDSFSQDRENFYVWFTVPFNA